MSAARGCRSWLVACWLASACGGEPGVRPDAGAPPPDAAAVPLQAAAAAVWQTLSVPLTAEAESTQLLQLPLQAAAEVLSLRVEAAGERPDPRLCLTLEDVLAVGQSGPWVGPAGVSDYAEFCSHCSERVSLGAGYGLFVLPSGEAEASPFSSLELRVALRDCSTLLPAGREIPRPRELRLHWSGRPEPARDAPLALALDVAIASRVGLPGGPGDPLLTAALAQLTEVWRAAGIALQPRLLELAPGAGPLRLAPDDRSALAALTRAARAGATDSSALLVLTPCLQLYDPLAGSTAPVQAITAHLPGGFGFADEPDGVFAAVETCGALTPQPRFLEPSALGALLAHELGHYLGLYHVREQDGTEDRLSDTLPGAPNLMQRMPDPSAPQLTESQVRVARRHPGLRAL